MGRQVFAFSSCECKHCQTTELKFEIITFSVANLVDLRHETRIINRKYFCVFLIVKNDNKNKLHAPVSSQSAGHVCLNRNYQKFTRPLYCRLFDNTETMQKTIILYLLRVPRFQILRPIEDCRSYQLYYDSR